MLKFSFIFLWEMTYIMATGKHNFQEQVLQQLNDEERVHFVFFYRQHCKRLGFAYLWLLFLGIFGMHKFYLNKRIGWIYLLFCWTLIPMLAAIIDLVLLPLQVRNYNRQLSIKLFDLIKKMAPSGSHLLQIEHKLRSFRVSLFEKIIALALIFTVIFPVIAYSAIRLSAHTLEIHYKTNHLDGTQNDSYLAL